MRNVVALVLGGGRGTRLFPLTSIRSKPAVPLGGMYRLIDIPLSNCINSTIRRIFVLTQFMSTSLHGHIRRTYNFDNFSGGYVEVLAAQETMSEGTDWYQGTADAVRKNLRQINRSDIDYVVILSGDQLYRMDYRKLIQSHRDSEADATIACMPVTREQARGFGIMQLDDHGRVRGFLEKPESDEAIDSVRTAPEWIDAKGIQSRGRDCLASMWIYVFNRELLVDVLENNSYADFGREVFPATLESHRVQTHLFDGYWEDIGTIRSFYDANIGLAHENPDFRLFTPEAPIYTRPRYLPPTNLGDVSVHNSLIANGCQIGKGSHIENSIIGLRTIIGNDVHVKDSIIMGADYYSDSSRKGRDSGATPPLGIGDHSRIYGTIVDKNCRIGCHVLTANDSGVVETDLQHPTCVIRDSIPIIVKSGQLPDGWTLNDFMVEQQKGKRPSAD
ncbi:MAG: glucose-1-phosphate adenylyltransferase [Planctomycetota bacterium]|nr:glucose-1-phosphate adenylyltransferase [Planctomycetota bacterium]